MPRKASKLVQTSPGCRPLRELLERAQTEDWSRWQQAQAPFLEAMWKFDESFSAGSATQGDNQNGKGDFFGDLVCGLLERCSEETLSYRPSVPGRIFRGHALDAAYPASGVVEVFVETKMAGAPKSPRNPSQKNRLGRAGSADLDKRVKEAGLKTIDLKAEWARNQGVGGGPTGDLLTWLRRTKPSCYILLAVRVVDDGDLQRTIRMAQSADQVMDGCGLFCYGPSVGRYAPLEVPLSLEMDRMVTRICEQLRELP
ncbi:MAG: hypothetical protein HZC42_00715 [Candidatus Eisenbacteria bacterium]|nr:hypothetical protein [Candidatus Eisenbacteria bacterium]